jgi:hypothetical protein
MAEFTFSGLSTIRNRVLDDETDTSESYTFLLVCVGKLCQFQRIVRMRKLFDDDNGDIPSVRCFDDELFCALFVRCSACFQNESTSVVSSRGVLSRFIPRFSEIEDLFGQSLVYNGTPILQEPDGFPGIVSITAGEEYRKLVKLCGDMRSRLCRIQLVVWKLQSDDILSRVEVTVFPPLDSWIL